MGVRMSARETLGSYKTEINSHDFDRVVPLLTSDCTFWFTSGTYTGIEEARRAFEKTWGMIVDEVYAVSDEAWVAEGDVAAACVYTYHWKGLIDGVMREGKGRGTTVFRQEAGRWRICHEHLSAFPPVAKA